MGIQDWSESIIVAELGDDDAFGPVLNLSLIHI